MITNNKKSEFDYPFLDFQNKKLPSWVEIESLLKFAEELRIERAALYDKILVFSWLQVPAVFFLFCDSIFLFFQFTQIGTISLTKTIFLTINSRPDLIVNAIILFFSLVVYLVVIEIIFLRKMRIIVNCESRKLGSIIDLIRDKSYLIDSNFSDFQKNKLKVHTSQFDQGIGSLTPMPWLVNVKTLLFSRPSH
jgi:hypothetical protein